MWNDFHGRMNSLILDSYYKLEQQCSPSGSLTERDNGVNLQHLALQHPNLETLHEPQVSILVLDALCQVHAGFVVLVAVHQLCMENRVLGLAIPLPLEVDSIR
jgi:hypothetical protein